jgi:DNA polymerase V
MWGIGPRMEHNLNNLKLYSVGDIARCDETILKRKFGIMGSELWSHANGIDESRIKDYKIISQDKSYSHSQVLFKDYNENNIKIIISEMIDVLCERLRKNHKETSVIGFGIGYSKAIGGGFYHSTKINATSNNKIILDICWLIFNKYYDYLPIRKVSIACGGLTESVGEQLNLFDNSINLKKDKKINETVDKIKSKYGRNSVIKASSLLEDSTAIERNQKIGGHHE